MRILMLFLFLFSFNNPLIAQQELEEQAYFYIDLIKEIDWDLKDPTLFQYLDSLRLLGGDYVWVEKLTRVEIYLDHQDSLDVATHLIDDCIAHFKTSKGNMKLLSQSYKRKAGILQNQHHLAEAFPYLQMGLDIAYSAKDTLEIIDSECEIGYFILDVFADSLEGVKHLNQSIKLAIAKQDWWVVYENHEYLTQLYIKKRNVDLAKQHAESALKYSLKIDSSNSARYDGYIVMTLYYLGIKDYNKALENALFCFKKASEMDDLHLVQTSACLLTEIYWLQNRVDSAYRYVEIASKLMEPNGEYLLRDYYYWASNVLEAKGMYAEALNHLEIFNYYRKKHLKKELIFAKEKKHYDQIMKTSALQQMEAEFSLKLSKRQSQLKSFLILATITFLLLVLFSALFFYKKKQEEQAINEELSILNEVIITQKEQLIENIKTLKKDISKQVPLKATYYFTQSAIQINFADIILLESSNNYVLIHTIKRQHPILERVKMIDLIKDFPPSTFIKIHRSYYVNKAHIIARSSKYKLTLSNEIQLNASRSYVLNLGDFLMKQKAS